MLSNYDKNWLRVALIPHSYFLEGELPKDAIHY